MNRNTAIAVAAGLAGGVLTHWIAPPRVFAQNPTPAAKEVRAQSFTLVDSDEHPAGTFSVESRSGTPCLERRASFCGTPAAA